jgi:riboflavin kinase/FMN adenylyltransferase
MKQIESIDALELASCELTIGSFDGIHLGHQSLINQLVARAKHRSIPPVVLTFFPHPSVVLRGRRPAFYISTPEEKAQRLGKLGVEYVITQHFDHDLSLISAREFLEWIRRKLHFKGLWVGENFALGHRREGNVDYLQNVINKWDFELNVVPPVFEGGEIVSSTRVREALRSGDVARVSKYLGRPFNMPGEVTKGSGRRKKLGIPTANLKVWDERAYPGSGVYACKVNYNGEALDAVTNIGIRPTFDKALEKPIIETHILEFDQDLYEKWIELTFIDRLRDERKFSGPDELLDQISRDIVRAKQILNSSINQ